jgi:hypothetical protein
MCEFEQQVTMKFFSCLGTLKLEILVTLSVIYGDESLKRSAVYYCYSFLKNG